MYSLWLAFLIFWLFRKHVEGAGSKVRAVCHEERVPHPSSTEANSGGEQSHVARGPEDSTQDARAGVESNSELAQGPHGAGQLPCYSLGRMHCLPKVKSPSRAAPESQLSHLTANQLPTGHSKGSPASNQV